VGKSPPLWYADRMRFMPTNDDDIARPARWKRPPGGVVDQLYLLVLDRGPDPSGRAGWVNFLSHGGTDTFPQGFHSGFGLRLVHIGQPIRRMGDRAGCQIRQALPHGRRTGPQPILRPGHKCRGSDRGTRFA
jgi:hypothetical protein